MVPEREQTPLGIRLLRIVPISGRPPKCSAWPPAETPETATSARKFPTPGRYELTLGWCIPVIMSEKTFSAKTSNELYVEELTLFAYALAEK